MHTTERFKAYRWAAAAPAEPVPPGQLWEPAVTVPRGLRTRLIWLAAGAFCQRLNTDLWFAVARLNFKRKGAPVGSFEFTDCSSIVTTTMRDDAPRALTRAKPDGNGSAQPSLQWREEIPAVSHDRDNIDLPCYELQIDCDQIEFEIEKTFAAIAPANAFNLLFGAKIVSL